MTSFFHFTHRLVRRFSHFCETSLQGPGSTCVLPASWGCPEAGVVRRIAHVLIPVEVSITTIRTTGYGAELRGTCRRGRIRTKEIPIHIFLQRYDA